METETTSSEAIALRCWIEGRRVWLELADQRILSFPAAKYPLLTSASPPELAAIQLRVGGRAPRWEALDEDIWMQDAVRGRFPKSFASLPAGSGTVVSR